MTLSGTLGERLIALRSWKKESQKELADAINIDQSSISRWEKGLRFPDAAMLRKIAEHFGVSPDALLSAPQIGPVKGSLPVVLCVEDSPPILDEFLYILRSTLSSAQIVGFRTAREALAFAAQTQVDLAFVDIELIGENGLRLAEVLSKINPRLNIVFLTYHEEYVLEALPLFFSGYVLKPLTAAKIKEQIAHLRYPVRGLELREPSSASNAGGADTIPQ